MTPQREERVVLPDMHLFESRVFLCLNAFMSITDDRPHPLFREVKERPTPAVPPKRAALPTFGEVSGVDHPSLSNAELQTLMENEDLESMAHVSDRAGKSS